MKYERERVVFVLPELLPLYPTEERRSAAAKMQTLVQTAICNLCGLPSGEDAIAVIAQEGGESKDGQVQARVFGLCSSGVMS